MRYDVAVGDQVGGVKDTRREASQARKAKKNIGCAGSRGAQIQQQKNQGDMATIPCLPFYAHLSFRIQTATTYRYSPPHVRVVVEMWSTNEHIFHYLFIRISYYI